MKKRVISLLLTLTLLFSLMPTSFGAGAGTAASDAFITLPPLEITSVEKVPADSEPGDVFAPGESMPRFFTSGEEPGEEQEQVYTTLESMAAAFREHFAARETPFTLTYQSQTELATGSDVTPILEETYRLALEHTPDEPTGGDYMKWQYHTCRCSASFGGYICHLTFTVEYYTTAEQETAVDEFVASFTDTYHPDEPGKSDYEKIEIIYDWLCDHVVYDYTAYEEGDPGYYLRHSAYAAAVNHNAVCQGYALLFYRLALTYGLDARVITGASYNESKGEWEGHAWNIVKLGGKYYLMDATWDAPRKVGGGEYLYFLQGSDGFDNHAPDTGDEQVTAADYYGALGVSTSKYEPPVVGDVNSDGVVDPLDMECLYEYLSTNVMTGALRDDPGSFLAMADVNTDGVVNILDYQRLYPMAIPPLQPGA